MKSFQDVHCNECGIEYRISWINENFQEPCKCACCGEDNIEVTESGVLV